MKKEDLSMYTRSLARHLLLILFKLEDIDNKLYCLNKKMS